jgi:hypothetical protein
LHIVEHRLQSCRVITGGVTSGGLDVPKGDTGDEHHRDHP